MSWGVSGMTLAWVTCDPDGMDFFAGTGPRALGFYLSG